MLSKNKWLTPGLNSYEVCLIFLVVPLPRKQEERPCMTIVMITEPKKYPWER